MRADQLIKYVLNEGKYDHLPALGYDDEMDYGAHGFNALIDKNGYVNHSQNAHAEMFTATPNVDPDRHDHSTDDVYVDNKFYDHHEHLVNDHGVRASIGDYSGEFEDPNEINVQMRHDSPTARHHAASFIRDNHKPGMSVYVDYVDPKLIGHPDHQLGGGAGKDPTVQSHNFDGQSAKRDAIAHLTTAKVGAKTAITQARSLQYGGD